MVPRANFEFCSNCSNRLGALFVGPLGGKSDALNLFLMVPRASFDFCTNCLNCLAGFFLALIATFSPLEGRPVEGRPFVVR